MDSQYITIGGFLNKLVNRLQKMMGTTDSEYLRRNGIIGDFEESHPNELIKKKTAALIVHGVLTKILKEADRRDYNAVSDMNDVYDCHICAMHICEVYSKGIIEAFSSKEFGINRYVDFSETEQILNRLFDETKRFETFKEIKEEIEYISEQDISLYRNDSLLVDVRNKEVFQKEMRYENAVNISIEAIRINPVLVLNACKEKGFNKIILFCNKGYLSYLAAKILSDNGIRNVFVLLPENEEH